MSDHLTILATLAQHEADHQRHREIVAGWLKEAGFSPLLRPSLPTRHAPGGCWTRCAANGNYAIRLDMFADQCAACLTSYDGRDVEYHRTAATPLEALRALVASGKVPRALLAGG